MLQGEVSVTRSASLSGLNTSGVSAVDWGLLVVIIISTHYLNESGTDFMSGIPRGLVTVTVCTQQGSVSRGQLSQGVTCHEDSCHVTRGTCGSHLITMVGGDTGGRGGRGGHSSGQGRRGRGELGRGRGREGRARCLGGGY